MNTDKTKRMKELVKLLNQASKAYYVDAVEIMSNFEYDKLYDELVSLEKETGIVLSNSPTIHVGYEVVSELPKEAHPAPMLSLDKTKSVEDLVSWMNDRACVLSWKLDGLTVVLTYENGELIKAVTRGNGEIGEVITANAKAFVNVPGRIECKDKLVIRGEAIITYSEFERINSEIEDAEAKYKNPRNLCSGSVRQLDSRITAERNVHFMAFTLIDPESESLREKVGDTFSARFRFLKEQGFDVVESELVTPEALPDVIQRFSEKIKTNDFPSDGLVLTFDDIAYGISLGRTAKFPRNAIAFKWQDEEAETVLREIEWSPSRTGLINPVAIFDTVSLEGTDVSRASVHNISIVEELSLGIGDTIKVYKANMIIPQISENLTRSGNLEIPNCCPACGGKTEIWDENGTRTLHCVNEECPAKNIKAFTHFVSRNAMNIEGISESTLEKFIECGYLRKLADLYHLADHKDEIVSMEGFGEKSYANLEEMIEKSRDCSPAAFLYALGVPNIGVANAKLIVRYFEQDIMRCTEASWEELCEIEGIGEVIAKAYVEFFQNDKKREELFALLKEVRFIVEEMNSEQDLSGLTFVITGSLNTFANRDELKNQIEQRGGKVAGSVSSKTSFLINNDNMSSSSKNKKAKSLGIPIITEEEFISGSFL